MAAERQKLQEALCSYTSETLTYFATVRDFHKRRSKWKSDRETELKMIKDIKERADKINLNMMHVFESEEKGRAIAEHMKNKMKVKKKREKLERELSSVLKETLGGLEELSCFLDALEKLAVTSLYVFMENQVLHLPKEINLDDVQVVIIAARQVCPLLLEFKRDADAFFLPKLQNVAVLSYQLDKYIQTTQIIIDMLETSSFSEFDLKMKMKMVVDLHVDLSEGDVQRMFSHFDHLDKIRKDQDFRMVFLFQEEEKCSGFINEFNERKPRMLQFLEELEEKAVQLDRINKGAKISSITGSSVGVVGGVLSIVGLALIPVTAGVSLGLIIGGTAMGVTSGVNSAVTTTTKIGINRKHQKKASKVFKSFMDDVQALQDCLVKVTKSETNQIDVAVGEDEVLLEAGVSQKGNAFLAYLKKNKGIKRFCEVVAKKSRHLQNMLASDVPGVGQAALKGPLVLSKAARGGLIAVTALFVGMDIFFICKDSISLAKGSESEFSQVIRARAELWRSEMDSWQKIHDSLSKGMLKSEENKTVLERLFYPEMKEKKQRETEMKIPSDEVDKKTEKEEMLNATVTNAAVTNAAVTNSLAVWLLVPLVFVNTLLLFILLLDKRPSQT